MNKIRKGFHILGLLLWSGVMCVGLFHLIGYNEYFNLFTIKTLAVQTYKTEVKNSRKNVKQNTIRIYYSYSVKGDKYSKYINVGEDFFKNKFKTLPNTKLEINYNTTFPQLSYVKCLRAEQYVHKRIIIVSLMFMIFISILYMVLPKILKTVGNWTKSRELRE